MSKIVRVNKSVYSKHTHNSSSYQHFLQRNDSSALFADAQIIERQNEIAWDRVK